MSENNENRKKRKKIVRQEWKPHWSLTLLHKIWMVFFSLFKIAAGALATVLVIGVVCMLVFAGILGDYLEEDILPGAGIEADSYDLELNSFIYYVDADGNIQTLQKIYGATNRQWADYEDIPENLIHAAVAIEDKRFFEHQGVDWITTIKACAGIFFGDADKGGSTITQQLIKNLTGDNSVTVQRKVQEIFRATQFEKYYEKEVILEHYLNRIYMGRRCFGVRTAAAKYFGKELEMLTLAECASLISITNNPSLYDPYGTSTYEFRTHGVLDGFGRNAVRKTDTLEEMLSQGWITQQEFDEAMAQELVLKDGIDFEDSMANCDDVSCGYKGLVRTFNKSESGIYTCPQCGKTAPISEDSSQEVYSWFVDTVLEDVAKALAEKDGVEWGSTEVRETYMDLIGRSGYHIYSTIDVEVQEQLDAVYTDMSQIPETRSGQDLQSAMVIIDNRTGDIVAMSGGVGEKVDFDAFNRATDSKLQTGSSIKPLTIYAPGFEVGAITPATVVKDLPYTYFDDVAWPKNENKKYSYSRTIYTAIEDSVNAVAVNTLDMIGTGYSFSFAKDQFGLSNLVSEYVTSSGEIKSDIDFSPLAMGAQTVGITVRDMASAYATFANNGEYRRGRTFTKVYDNEGNLILDNTQQTNQILSEKTVNYMNYCLDRAVAAGTGTAADFSGMNVYGKTGSTSSNRDRWFCGYTGYYTTAVWCGYDTPEQIILVGNTKNPAARLFKAVMEPLHEGKENVTLLDKGDMTTVTVCLDSGKLATEACEADVRSGYARTEKVMVYREDKPTEKCDAHVTVQYCTEGHGVANEYCIKMAEAGKLTLSNVSLVKMTQEHLDEIIKAEKFSDPDNILNNNYIYLIKKDGSDASFKGIKGNANKGVNAPYIVCTEHTKSDWQQSQLPTLPGFPDFPFFPGDDPAEPTESIGGE